VRVKVSARDRVRVRAGVRARVRAGVRAGVRARARARVRAGVRVALVRQLLCGEAGREVETHLRHLARGRG